MTDTKHTGREWSAERDDYIMDKDHWLSTQYIRADKSVVALTTECWGRWTPEQVKANARRIVDCVNACEGMEDPANAIEGMKTACKDLLDKGANLPAELLVPIANAINKAMGA